MVLAIIGATYITGRLGLPLLAWSGGDAAPVAMFMEGIALLAVIAAAIAPETLGRSLDADTPTGVSLFNRKITRPLRRNRATSRS